MNEFRDDVGRHMLRYEVALFVLAAVSGRLLFGRLTLDTYARMLAWAALLSWVFAVLTFGLRWILLRFEFDPTTYRHGRRQFADWSSFFFLAGMVPFAASALLGWLA